MIIIGYQGIGKSTLGISNLKYIDLESGCFWTDGTRPDDWYKYYCQIAEHLSNQGYVVFVSSHDVVRKWFINTPAVLNINKVIVAYPSLALKDAWIKKLQDRYECTKLDKDYKAWMNAVDRYEENIKEISDDGDKLSGKLELKSIDYDLESEIMSVVSRL